MLEKIFIWNVEPVICLEHQRRYPQENSQVTVKMPLFSPRAHENSTCLCQNIKCPIAIAGACNRRATFTEVFPDLDSLVGTITPELYSSFNPRPIFSGT